MVFETRVGKRNWLLQSRALLVLVFTALVLCSWVLEQAAVT